jgi:hypothetical protein
MLPTCVHVTLQDEIFVGIVDSDSKNMDSGSRRTILKLTCEGIKKADLALSVPEYVNLTSPLSLIPIIRPVNALCLSMTTISLVTSLTQHR